MRQQTTVFIPDEDDAEMILQGRRVANNGDVRLITHSLSPLLVPLKP